MELGAELREQSSGREIALLHFDHWAENYLQATMAEKVEMEAVGRDLAQARRAVFKELITHDPQGALIDAVPMVVRQKLPPSVVALLEERVSARGVLRQYRAAPEPDYEGPPVYRFAELEDGRTMRAYVYGRRALETGWSMNASLNGVAMDGQFAVHESPVRPLEIGEVADPRKRAIDVCPISGKVSVTVASLEPVTAATPAVEANGEIVYLCDPEHIEQYEELLIMGDASSGGAHHFTGILPSSPTPTLGELKVLFISVIFPDQGQVPLSEAASHTMMRDAADYFQEMSYGRLSITATVTPPVILPRNQAWYRGKHVQGGFIQEIDGVGQEMAHAKEEARKLGYDWQDYHVTIVRGNGGALAPTNLGGGGNVWMRNDSSRVCIHELGHALGLTHANFWQTDGASVIGPGNNLEYGYIYDIMGAPLASHWNVSAKHKLHWLPEEFVPPITRSGTYRIHAFDTPRIESGRRYALRLIKDHGRTYWGEFRTLFPANPWTSNGLLLGWSWPGNGDDNSQLLDTTPGSPHDRLDAAITLGRTFSDHEAGIHVTTLAVNPETNPPSLDVRVNLGNFPSNQPPTLSLTPSTPVTPTNMPVTFTATANDPDGDELSYGWIWHDSTVSPNEAQVTRTFQSSGVYTLSCVVSDMKGGTAIRNAVITVGSGGGSFTISGRLTQAGAGLTGIHVSASGANGTLTDSDGYYTISNLPAGNYTVTPARHGLIFRELFNNSITVGPSNNGANFAADELPAVTLSAPDSLAAEGGDTGTFRLQRSGSTALPLNVYVFVAQGTAIRGTDYTLNPDYAPVTGTPYQQWTIPEGAEFLDVTVTPVDDATQEGYETVTLVLGQDSSFVAGASISATVGIVDNDTPLPRVSLTANTSQVNEGEATPIICTVTRTGATTSSLDVAYAAALGSTADAGMDYEDLPGTVTIPAGAASADFEIRPIDDAMFEATETVRIAITTNAAFIADASANTVVARILDDDAQVLTVTLADDDATEVDLTQPGAIPDPATFLLTRSGEVSGSLTVHYSVTGSAQHGTDYEALSGRVDFAAGERRATVTILPRADSFGEPPETVVLKLSAGYGYKLGDSSSGTAVIHDSGAPPFLEVRAQSTIAAEPSTHGNFRITGIGTGTGTLTVRYRVSGSATAGVDYQISGLNPATLEGTAEVTLQNDIVATNLVVTVLDDALAEELETIELTLLPDPSYTLWGPRSTSRMLLRDNEQPTVFVDGQVGNTGSHSVAENATTTNCKFWISRTGSTASPLTVNYSMTGSATHGVDYTELSGVVVIPAGAPGVDVVFKTLDDSIFEGNETVVLQLQPGGYARGSDAILNITDNEGGGPVVSFAATGGSGLESQTEASIPVQLNEAANVPVTVNYHLEAGARTTSLLSGNWLRIVKTGTSFESYVSRDGVNFTKTSSTRAISGFPTSYLAGLLVSSANTSLTTAVEFDSVTVTGLSSGGSVGARVSASLPGSAPAGSATGGNGSYRVVGGGPDFALNGTTDGGHLLCFPITNSANCTITARVLSVTGTSGVLRPGIIITEALSDNARRFAYIIDGEGRTRQAFRVETGGTSGNALIQNNFAKPQWLRLQRTGNIFTTYVSADGSSFMPYAGGLTIPLAADVLVGLAVSARNDNLITQAAFDNVTIMPPSALPLQGRDIGFVNTPGSVAHNGGSYAITASGAGIMASMNSTEDEAHFLSVPVSGDFTLTARLVSIQGGANGAQAGLMVRESSDRRCRALQFGLVGSATSTSELRARLSGTTSGEGLGVDYHLEPGMLTFDPGETEKMIPLQIHDDAVAEPNETVHVMLSQPHQSMLGAPSTYAYTIIDNDGPLSELPVVGFAGGASNGLETETPAEIVVAISRPGTGVITVGYATGAGGSATAGVDFAAVSGVLTFAPGDTVRTIALPVLNDAEVEGPETVELVLTTTAGAIFSTSVTHQFTILDDDTPLVTVMSSDGTATEGGDTGTFTFSRTGSTAGELTVNYLTEGTAVSGVDFTTFSPSGSITIPAGAVSVDLAVNTLQDAEPEIDETVIVTLKPGNSYEIGGTNAATVVIKDDDVNTVTLTVTDGAASEAGDDPGELLLTRTGPLTAELTVNFSVTGTAWPAADYQGLGTSRTFSAGQSTIAIPVVGIADEEIEGDEHVVVWLQPAPNVIVGAPSAAQVLIVDDDLPPSVFISSPASKSAIIAEGNGLMLEATASDDGLPASLTYTWSRLFGPGTVTFENAHSATTGVTFSAPGVHGIRVTVDDGQFTASDVVFVQQGEFAIAKWVSQDQGSPVVRGAGGESNGSFALVGGGAGYSDGEDSGHMLFRQLTATGGNATITARITGLTGPSTRLAGITLRDTSWKTSARVNLLLDGSGNVQVRSRMFSFANDNTVTTPGFTLPLWLRLERIGDFVVAATAPDVGGTAGAWTDAGEAMLWNLGSNIVVGLVVSSDSDAAASSTAHFDHVQLSPDPGEATVHSEDMGYYWQRGSSSVDGGITTVNAVGYYDDDGGHFRYQQVWGDCVVTTRLLTQEAVAQGAQVGIGIRDTTDEGPHAFYGQTSTNGFEAHWRSTPGGATGVLQTGGSLGNWVRLVRKGNAITAYRAADAGGTPGSWVQVSNSLPAVLTDPLLVGLVVDSNSGSLMGTGTFSGLTIEPLNRAPVVNAGPAPTHGNPTLAAVVFDDGQPNPPAAVTLSWTAVSAPGVVTFGQPHGLTSSVSFSQNGPHTLRLVADDGESRAFADLSFTVLSSYQRWLQQHSLLDHPLSGPLQDADHDGLSNILEYALNLSGSTPDADAIAYEVVQMSGSRYLRMTLPKNPEATDMVFEPEATGDLNNPSSWSNSNLVIELNTTTLLQVRDTVPIGAGGRRFMRVRVVMLP